MARHGRNGTAQHDVSWKFKAGGAWQGRSWTDWLGKAGQACPGGSRTCEGWLCWPWQGWAGRVRLVSAVPGWLGRAGSACRSSASHGFAWNGVAGSVRTDNVRRGSELQGMARQAWQDVVGHGVSRRSFPRQAGRRSVRRGYVGNGMAGMSRHGAATLGQSLRGRRCWVTLGTVGRVTAGIARRDVARLGAAWLGRRDEASSRGARSGELTLVAAGTSVRGAASHDREWQVRLGCASLGKDRTGTAAQGPAGGAGRPWARLCRGTARQATQGMLRYCASRRGGSRQARSGNAALVRPVFRTAGSSRHA